MTYQDTHVSCDRRRYTLASLPGFVTHTPDAAIEVSGKLTRGATFSDRSFHGAEVVDCVFLLVERCNFGVVE